jgi:hypothetical protein
MKESPDYWRTDGTHASGVLPEEVTNSGQEIDTPRRAYRYATKTPLALIILDGFGYRAELKATRLHWRHAFLHASCSRNTRTL